MGWWWWVVDLVLANTHTLTDCTCVTSTRHEAYVRKILSHHSAEKHFFPALSCFPNYTHTHTRMPPRVWCCMKCKIFKFFSGFTNFLAAATRCVRMHILCGTAEICVVCNIFTSSSSFFWFCVFSVLLELLFRGSSTPRPHYHQKVSIFFLALTWLC